MDRPTQRCAVVNDFSGFGRCSVSVALPVISAMGICCSCVPTAILSNHTGYPNYFFDSYTDKMSDFLAQWKKLSLKFDTIYSGFLGCEKQIDIVCDFIGDFLDEGGTVLVDPVMGDGGKIYTTYNEQMCKKMRKLASLADIITPNITEACILLGREYLGEEISDKQAIELLCGLNMKGKRSVLITGIISGEDIKTAVFDSKTGETKIISNKRAKISYPGTGDLFASVLCGGVTNGMPLFEAAALASSFVEKASTYTSNFKTDVNDGIAFEPFISSLIN